MSKSWIQSFSGKMIHVLEPRRETVCLADVAQGLALKNRFSGQTSVPYSVAAHCVIGARWLLANGERVAATGFLLHELGEVYLPDIPAPVKPFLKVEVPWAPCLVAWHDLERVHEIAILSGLGLDGYYPATRLPRVKEMDLRMLRWEARDLLGSTPAPWWPEGEAPMPLTPDHILTHMSATEGRLCFEDAKEWLAMLKELTGIVS